MKLDNTLFDKIQEQAEASPRKRMHYDLRTQIEPEVAAQGWEDTSQRILNVLMPETVIPIHRHPDSSETVIICRGSVREEFYDAEGNNIAEFVLTAGVTWLISQMIT